MRKALGKNKQYILFFLFFCGADAFVFPYLSLYFSQQGLSGGQIGVINALSYVTAVGAGLLVGFAADHTGRPRLTLTLSLFGVLAAIWGLTCCRSFWPLCIASIAYTFFYVPSGDIGDKLLLDGLQGAARLFGVFRFGGPLGYSLGVLAAGMIAVRYTLRHVFLTGAAVMLLAIALTPLMPVEQHSGDTGIISPRDLTRQHSSAYLYGVLLLWGFIESGALPYVSVFMGHWGFAEDYTAALIAAAMLGQIVGYLSLPAITRHLGGHRAVGAGFCLMAVRVAGFVWARALPAPAMLSIQLLGGVSQPLVLGSITSMISQDFAGGAGTTALTLKTTFNRGIGGSLGALLFGLLYGWWVPWKVMCLFAGLSLLFACLAIGWGKRIYTAQN